MKVGIVRLNHGVVDFFNEIFFQLIFFERSSINYIRYNFQVEDVAFLKESLVLRLKDDNKSVVKAALQIGQVPFEWLFQFTVRKACENMARNG